MEVRVAGVAGARGLLVASLEADCARNLECSAAEVLSCDQEFCRGLHTQANAPPWGRGAGAFPEVQVVQFPLGMGRPDKAGKGGPGTLAVTVGSDGGINYDAVVKQGRNRDKVVAATHGAMVPKLDRLTDGVRRPAALLLCARL